MVHFWEADTNSDSKLWAASPRNLQQLNMKDGDSVDADNILFSTDVVGSKNPNPDSHRFDLYLLASHQHSF